MSRIAVIALILTAIVAATAILLFEHRAPGQPAPTLAHPSSSSLDVTPATQPAARPAEPTVGVPAEAPVVGDAESLVIRGLSTRSLVSCSRHLSMKRGLEQFGCERIDESDTLAKDHCRAQIADFNRRLQEATANAAHCPESLVHPSAYYQAVKALAERGDVDAQRCFIQGYFGIERELGMHLSQAEHDEYAPLARKYIAARFEQGDWSVVRWLSMARPHIADFLLASAYPIGIDHPETYYKMNLLLVLGNQPSGRLLQQDDPKRIVEFYRRQKRLTPEQFAAAERWARDLYDQRFNGSQEGASILLDTFCDAG